MNTYQPPQRSRPLVAILNTALETMELLQDFLADEGMDTVCAYVHEFKRGQRDLEAFFAEHQPDAVTFDIALPYVENWKFFKEQVLARKFLPDNRFICTTVNRTVLDVLVGPTHAFELVGRPFDLEDLVAAIKRAVSGGAAE